MFHVCATMGSRYDIAGMLSCSNIVTTRLHATPAQLQAIREQNVLDVKLYVIGDGI